MFLKFLLLLVFKIESKECPHDGIFSVPNTACKSYTICSQISATNYNCPPPSLFDQRAGQCVLDLICPDITICANSPAGLYPDPNYPDNNKYYIECFGVDSFNITYGECNKGEIFLSGIGKCERVENTTETTISTESWDSTAMDTTLTNVETTIIPIETETIPTSSIIPIETVPTSSIIPTEPTETIPTSSIIPIETIPTSSITPTETIPTSSIIPTETIPTSTIIPTETISTSTIIPTETIPTTTSISTLIPPTSDCYKEGMFPVYQSDCKIYKICYDFGTSFTEEYFRCNTMSFFDPWKNDCVSDYKCVENLCQTQAEGIFYLDPNDSEKRRFYQCVSDGEFILPVYYRCGEETIFDEEKEKCVKNVGIMQWVTSKLKWVFGL